MMKVIAKKIDVIGNFSKDGTVTPIKFKIEGDDESFRIIKVDKVLYRTSEKLAGNPMIRFTCQSLINNVNRVYELKLEVMTLKWMLFKM